MPVSQARGFSLIELMVSMAILFVVVGTAVNYIAIATQRSKMEQTKVDLAQEGREFVDEFERDIHQAGYPGCDFFNGLGSTNCATTANYNKATLAMGLVSISYTNIIFEGDVNGDGLVESVQYRLVDANLNYPPASCPCILQRSQVTKLAGQSVVITAGAPAYAQATSWSQELQNIVNSGSPAANAAYGGGVPISGNVLFGGGSISNDAYYAAVSSFKDFPVFCAYDQDGSLVQLPLDATTLAGQQALRSIRSIRLTINLLGSGLSGYDMKTGLRPVVTLVGDARRSNKMAWE
jgi:prepilin-type N-terminal cleavage/methylation domain-containing protein